MTIPPAYCCRKRTIVLATCLLFPLLTPIHAQLTWMRSDKKGVAPAGSGTKIRLNVPAGERVTFYTTDFPQLTLSAPGVSAKATLAFSIEGDISALEAGTHRFFAMGLFSNRDTTPEGDFSDDCGYFVQLKGITADSSFIELRKRLGNGKSPLLLNPSSEARANMSASKDMYSGGALTEHVQYQLVFRLARTGRGVSFGEGRQPTTAGVWISGGGMSITSSSSEPDLNPETMSFNQFGILFNNTSSKEVWVNIDSLQLEMRKDGELISIMTRPTITAQPEDVSVIAGSPLALSVEAVGEALVYQWKKNGDPIAGATTTTFGIEEAGLDDLGVYSVEISNPYGQVRSSSATVVVKQMIRVQPSFPPAPEVVFDETAVEVKPTIKKAPRIRYPSSLRKRDATGESVLRFVVTRDGYVDALEVLSYVDKDVVEPLMAAYENVRFEPGAKEGKPVNVRVTLTLPYPPKK